MNPKYLTRTKWAPLFSNPNSSISAYVYGLLWADGWFTPSSMRIETCASDMEYFKTLLSQTGNWKFYSRNRSGRKPQTSAVLAASLWSDQLKQWNYVTKRLDLSSIFNVIDTKYKNIFLLGLFDGDGCLYLNQNYRTIQWSICGHRDFEWHPLIDYLFTLGITARVHKAKSSSQIRITDSQNVLRVMELLYKGHDLGLPRKKLKFHQAQSQWAHKLANTVRP